MPTLGFGLAAVAMGRQWRTRWAIQVLVVAIVGLVMASVLTAA